MIFISDVEGIATAEFARRSRKDKGRKRLSKSTRRTIARAAGLGAIGTAGLGAVALSRKGKKSAPIYSPNRALPSSSRPVFEPKPVGAGTQKRWAQERQSISKAPGGKLRVSPGVLAIGGLVGANVGLRVVRARKRRQKAEKGKKK